MRVDLLGTVGVRSEAGSLAGRELGGRRARLVLAALGLADGPVAADALAEIVWDGAAPATWPSALRGVILGLRGTLDRVGLGEQRLIATTPNGYSLAADAEVDVRVMLARIDEAERVLADDRAASAVELLAGHDQLSGARLLPGDDGEWLAGQRERITALAQQAALVFVGAASAAGDHSAAISSARRLVSANPLDERGQQSLIRVLDAAGDRAGAIAAYDECRTVLADRLGVDPGTATVDAYLRALRSDARVRVGGLPARRSTFFGRSTELGEFERAVGEPGLVTVTGVGGIGKSRLVIEAMSMGPREFEGGVMWVELGALVDDELVAITVSHELGLAAAADDGFDGLVEFLAPLGRAALILDGCDRILDGAATLATSLTSACPNLTVVCTARQPLGLTAERLLRLAPLGEAPPAGGEAPTSDPEAPRNPATELLLDRARVGGRAISVDDSTQPLLDALVRRSGGVPLALELLAAQLAVQSIGDLMDSLPPTNARDDGLRVILQQSVETLSGAEAEVFRRIAVLDGPVRLPLIRGVVAGAELPPARVVRILAQLSDRGLMRIDTAGARWSYEQDDDIHRFAFDLLDGAGEVRETHERLFAAVLALLPDDPKLPPAQYLDAINEVLPSIRSLLGAAVDGRIERARGLELGFRLHRYWAATGVSEGRFWLMRLLAEPDESTWSAFATFALGYLSYWAGDVDAALDELTSAARLLTGIDDSYTARALIFAAGIADDVDRGTEAVAQLRQAVELANRLGEAGLRSAAISGIGSVLAERGDPEAALHAAESVALSRAGGSSDQLAIVLANAAMVCWQVGDSGNARAYAREARTLLADSKRIARVIALTTTAALALADRDFAAAVDFAGQADADATELGVEREVPLVRCILARALAESGSVQDAARAAVRAIEAARALDYAFPLALCLETAAFVLTHAPAVDRSREAGARLVATAAFIRARGDRPAPPSLRPEDTSSSGEALPLERAIQLALAELNEVELSSRSRL